MKSTTLASHVATRFHGGILGDRVHKNLHGLVLTLDESQFETAYREVHDGWYAEPEFAGHYVRAMTATARNEGLEEPLKRAQRVTGWMTRYQRADGYLGTYRSGLEFDDSFSVWNQQFSIMALLDMYLANGDLEALATARRCADYIESSYRAPDSALHLLNAINQGIENSCILLEFVRLAEISGEPRYLDFAAWIVETMATSHLRLVEATEGEVHPLLGARIPSTIRLGGPKAIESLICYRGLLRLAINASDERAIQAVRNHWQDLMDWQIGPTGAGSMGELWPLHGYHPMPVATELRPNENCAGVGWMELNIDLFGVDGEARYIDEFERTLYNHLLGSQAIDGSDFSYYQGNVGAKIHTTRELQYSCCRYRGMGMLASLAEHVVRATPDGPAVLLYADATSVLTVDGATVTVRQETDYPRTGRVRITIDTDFPRRFPLRLRRPGSATDFTVRVNGTLQPTIDLDRGFAVIDREWRSGDTVDLAIEFTPKRTVVKFGDDLLAITSFGALVLAIDSRENGSLGAVRVDGDEAPALHPDHPNDWSRIVRFSAAATGNASVAFVDYASAGSLDPAVDRFQIWVTAGATQPLGPASLSSIAAGLD